MTIKIIAVTKSLNEEHNIERFCRGYDWADLILVADGGSQDDTVALAQSFIKVRVRDFPLRVPMLGDPTGFMNPEPQHLNFIIDWAIEEEADWIILDGCDCWPNPTLKREARRILETSPQPSVWLHRLYIWGDDEYFPKYNICHSMWAWRPAELPIRWEEKTLSCFDSEMIGGDLSLAIFLDEPYCCLHYCFPDEEEVAAKMARYKAWGHDLVHPLKSIYAPSEPLPEWALK